MLKIAAAMPKEHLIADLAVGMLHKGEADLDHTGSRPH
jgi:hypothetical protein